MTHSLARFIAVVKNKIKHTFNTAKDAFDLVDEKGAKVLRKKEIVTLMSFLQMTYDLREIDEFLKKFGKKLGNYNSHGLDFECFDKCFGDALFTN